MGELDIEILMTHSYERNVYGYMSTTGVNAGRDNWLLHGFDGRADLPPASVNAYQARGWRVWYRLKPTDEWNRMMTPEERARML